MKKFLSSLKKDRYVIAGVIYGLADGILDISNNWLEFFLYLIPFIFIIFLLELLYKKFVKK